MNLDEQYRRALSERIPITEGKIMYVCADCNGPIRTGEPVRQQGDGKFVHWFMHTCRDEKDFSALQLKVMGITLNETL